jgi:DNA polymerase III alpha subunit
MANLRFADMEMDVEVVVFPAYWKEVNEADIYDGAMGVLTGKVEREGDDEENSTVKIIFDSWERMDVSDLLGGTPIHLEMNRQPDTAQVERLCGIMNKVHGDSPVFLTFTENGKRITIRFKGATSYEIKDDLVKIVGLMELTV